MRTNLKRKDFLEKDKELAFNLLFSLRLDGKNQHLIPAFQAWLEDLDDQLDNYDN